MVCALINFLPDSNPPHVLSDDSAFKTDKSNFILLGITGDNKIAHILNASAPV